MKIASGHPELVEIVRINKNLKLIGLLQKYQAMKGIIPAAPQLKVESIPTENKTVLLRKAKQRGEQSLRIWVLRKNALKSLQNYKAQQRIPEPSKNASKNCVIL